MKSNLLFLIFLSWSIICSAQENNFNNYNAIPLGDAVNSQYNEICPLPDADGKTLYFVKVNYPDTTSRKCSKKICSQDIWYSELKENGDWGTAQKMGEPFNRNAFNSIINISSDGLNLLVRGGFDEENYNNNMLAVSYKNRSGWSEPQVLKIDNYRKMNKGLYDGGCFAGNNSVLVLFFADKKGNINLHVSFLNDEGTWSKPLRLPDNINQGNQISPFVAVDDRTMYFASDKPGGYGEYDIYMTQRLDDSWLNWSEPVNLGAGVNSKGWEGYYSTDTKGEYAYFTSNKLSGNADIFKVKLKEESRPLPMAFVSGKLISDNGKLISEGAITCEVVGDKESAVRVNITDHAFKLNLIPGKKYRLHADIEGYVSVAEILDLTNVESNTEVFANIRVVPADDYKPLSLLTEGSHEELDSLIKTLTDNPSMVIELKDFAGTNQKDFDLRVKNLKKYLVSHGVSEERISILTAEGDLQVIFED